jgi:molybdate transport system substrate-binding protein
MGTKKICISLSMAVFILWSSALFAGDKLTIAVAANFMLPFEEIAHTFEKKTSVKISATFTSTGNLYAQIINGAPYDLFLAADESRPELLHKQGLAGEPFLYAQGRLILWTAKEKICAAKDWQKALQMQTVNSVSIANPETAPYGAAAIKAMEITGMEMIVTKKLVFAQNVVQSFQYAHTESVDAGFCALSSVLSKQGKMGCYFLIEQAPVIVQKACIIKRSNKKDVEKFVAFLLSSEAQAVKQKYGYE